MDAVSSLDGTLPIAAKLLGSVLKKYLLVQRLRDYENTKNEFFNLNKS